MITLQCDQCSKEIKIKPYLLEKVEHHFCDAKCYGLWQRVHRVGIGRNRVAVSCYACGKEFEKQPCQVADRNFCSRECWGKWRTSSEWCGENSPAWRGGHIDYRGSNWDEQKQKALERDSYICQRCGATDNRLEVHHRVPYQLFDNYIEANQLSNLITLCVYCHGTVEAEFWNAHPELIEDRRYPYTIMSKKRCKKCGELFQPRSPASKICDACCTFTCANCGTIFYTRKHSGRNPKYCSRSCRNEFIREHGFPHRIPRLTNSLST